MSLTDRNSDPVVVGDDLVLAGKVYKDLGSNRALVESGGQLHVMDVNDCLLAASVGGGGGVTDHGALTGLADDDHSIYHTDARGDARYSALGHDHDTDYAALSHTHATSDVTGLDAALAGKAPTSHTHGTADVQFTATDRVLLRQTTGGGAGEEWPCYDPGRDLLASASAAAARAVLGLGTAAIVNTGTGASDVPTITQADARYDAAGEAAGAVSVHVAASDPHTVYAKKASNLSDLASASTARTNLGLGTAATLNSGTSAANLPPMSAHVDAQDPGNVGMPVKMDSSGNLPAHTHASLYQPLDATLTALAGLATGADRLPYSTGTDTFSQATFTAAGRALVDDADATAQRATLGLGNAALATTGVAASTDLPTRAHVLRPLAQTLDSTEVTTSAAEQTLCDLTVPANAMGANGGVWLRISMYFYNATGANVSSTVKVYWGGTLYWADIYGAHPSTSTYHAMHINVYVDNLGATNKQKVSGFISGSVNTGASTGEGNWGTTSPSNPFSNAQSTYPAKDTTSAQNVKVTWQMGTSSANARIKLDVARLVVMPGA